MAHVDLVRVAQGVDAILRHWHGIHDFTDDPDCVFRISLIRAATSLRFADGTHVGEGDPVLELHFWNEHLPIMPAAGPSVAWAGQLARQMRRSLHLLDRHLEREDPLREVVALSGATPFSSRLGMIQVLRTGRRFGFELFETDEEAERSYRLHTLFDSMLLWGLGWTFNRASLRGKALLRHRHQLWMSRARLHDRYGAASTAPAPPALVAMTCR
jgi:hypothetical protein